MFLNTEELAHVYSCIFQRSQRLSQLENIDLRNMRRFWKNSSRNEIIETVMIFGLVLFYLINLGTLATGGFFTGKII